MDTNRDPKSSVLKGRAVRFGQKFKVKVDWPIELTNITGTRLENINDDCLLEIFSVKTLNLMDICSIAQTCSRFHQIAERIFPKKLALRKCCSDNNVYFVESEKYYGQMLKGQDVERVFTNFGVILSKFSLSSSISTCGRESLDGLFMNAVTSNYFDNLEMLQIRGFKMPGICSDKFKQIFKRLQLLDLQFVSTGDTRLFEGLDSLVELTLTHVNGCSAILTSVFPKLERFIYGTCDIVETDPINNPAKSPSLDTLITFILRHNALKALDLCFFSYAKCLKSLLQAIGTSCKEVMQLRIRVVLSTFSSSHLKPLRAFRSLRFLELWEVPCGSFRFISGQKELRELHLHGCDLPEDINQYSALAPLKKLVIHDCRTAGGFDLVQAIDRLKNIEELEISWLYHQSNKFSLSKNSFTKIADTVRDRHQVLTLKCEFNFDLNDSAKSPKIHLVYYIDDDEC